MGDQKNLIIAFALALGVLLVWDMFVFQPERKRMEAELAAQDAAKAASQTLQTNPNDDLSPQAPSMAPANIAPPRADVIGKTARLPFENSEIMGSISLTGARLDDLTLTQYFETIEREDNVVLLSPGKTANPYYIEMGWIAPQGEVIAVPNAQTVWTPSASKLTPQSPVTLSWDNGSGLVFKRTYELDENYLFTVTQSVENSTASDVQLFPYGQIFRRNLPELENFFVLHEGPLGVFEGSLKEVDYDDIRDDGPSSFTSTDGWIGITDKYWLTTLVPSQGEAFTSEMKQPRGFSDAYIVNFREDPRLIPAGGSASVTNAVFAGAKTVELIDEYEQKLGIRMFDRTIDWGWFYFLTKPIFYALKFFYGIVGNFGIAIILLTVGIKGLLFPLANKQFESFAKMKVLQPKMKALQERFKDDKQKLQMEMMQLYKKEKVNPLSGCLPIFVQIPIFFSLYKVLFVTIEMRHAPFFGWIKDLSAPDPLTPVNLFGALAFDPPQMIAIGIWPIIMGVSMWLQQKMNPTPMDPTQAKIMSFLPIIFTFILAPFAAGLVIYWTWNNLLSIAQQWVIQRKVAAKAEAK
ncbi:MAG: membrane protein insertase YidC [Pseudomonadota bacterium]